MLSTYHSCLQAATSYLSHNLHCTFLDLDHQAEHMFRDEAFLGCPTSQLWREEFPTHQSAVCLCCCKDGLLFLMMWTSGHSIVYHIQGCCIFSLWNMYRLLWSVIQEQHTITWSFMITCVWSSIWFEFVSEHNVLWNSCLVVCILLLC